MRKQILIMFLLTGLIACGQDMRKDLSELYNAYTSDLLSMDFTVSMYEKPNGKEQVLSEGFIRKNKNLYYTKFAGVTNVLNNEGSLTVDSRTRKITFIPGQKYNLKVDKMDPFAIDTLLKYAGRDTVKYLGEKDGVVHYRIIDHDSPVTSTDLFMNKQSKFITRLEYTYDTDNKDASYGIYKMVIRYKKVSTSEMPDQKVFSRTNYVLKKNGVWVASLAYPNYSVAIINAKS